MKEAMLSIGGEPLERAGVAGVPALLGQISGMVGVDLSGSQRIGFPSSQTRAKAPAKPSFGVWGERGKKMANAWQSVGREDYLRAIEFASPAFFENVLKAQRVTSIGSTTPQGKVLYDEKGKPIKETVGEGIAQGMGFRRRGSPKLRKSAGNSATSKQNSTSAGTISMPDSGWPMMHGRQKVIRDVQKYNLEAMKFRGAVPMINAEILRRSFASKPEERYLAWDAQS